MILMVIDGKILPDLADDDKGGMKVIGFHILTFYAE